MPRGDPLAPPGVQRVLDSASLAVQRGLQPASHGDGPSSPAHYAAAALALLDAPDRYVLATCLEDVISVAGAAALIELNMLSLQQARPLGLGETRAQLTPLPRLFRPCSRAEQHLWAGMRDTLRTVAKPLLCDTTL